MSDSPLQEQEQPDQAPDLDLADQSRTGSSRLSTALVAIATVLAVVSVFSTWVKLQALQTDTWVSLADELLRQPEVQEALAVYLVDELYLQLDVSNEIENGLPEDFQGLAGPISSALRGPATTGAERLIASDEFRTVWISVNRTTHETLVAILRDETRPGISTADGTVSLELQELLRRVGSQFGLSAETLDQLPEDAGRITIFESDELRTAQRTVQVLDFVSWFLFLVVVALYAAAVYLAPGRRRLVLRNIGFSLIGAAVVTLRRTTRAEYADVTFSDLIDQVRNGMSRPQPADQLTATEQTAATTALTTELTALRELHENGALADDKDTRAKERVLAGG